MQKHVDFRTHPKTIHMLWLLFASNPAYMHHPTEVQSSICTSDGDGKSVRKLREFPEIDRLHMEWEVGRWCAEGWYGVDAFTWTDEFEGTYLASLQDLAGISDDDAWMWVMAWIRKILWSRIESSAQRPYKEEMVVFYCCEFVCSGDHFGAANKKTDKNNQ